MGRPLLTVGVRALLRAVNEPQMNLVALNLVCFLAPLISDFVILTMTSSKQPRTLIMADLTQLGLDWLLARNFLLLAKAVSPTENGPGLTMAQSCACPS